MMQHRTSLDGPSAKKQKTDKSGPQSRKLPTFGDVAWKVEEDFKLAVADCVDKTENIICKKLGKSVAQTIAKEVETVMLKTIGTTFKGFVEGAAKIESDSKESVSLEEIKELRNKIKTLQHVKSELQKQEALLTAELKVAAGITPKMNPLEEKPLNVQDVQKSLRDGNHYQKLSRQLVSAIENKMSH